MTRDTGLNVERVTVCGRCFKNGKNVELKSADCCPECGSWYAHTIDRPSARRSDGWGGDMSDTGFPMAYGPRDWAEEAIRENGNYFCICYKCSERFIGYKRRVICKLCSTSPTPPKPEGQ